VRIGEVLKSTASDIEGRSLTFGMDYSRILFYGKSLGRLNFPNDHTSRYRPDSCRFVYRFREKGGPVEIKGSWFSWAFKGESILPNLPLLRKWGYLVEIFYEKKRGIFVEYRKKLILQAPLRRVFIR
jgi:hypothetical protein